MNLSASIAAIWLGAAFCFAQTIDISGVVKDSASGGPIADAEVRLVVAGLKDTTGGDGKFQLKGSITSILGSAAPAFSSVPVVSGQGTVTFGLTGRGQVTINTYTTRGELVHTFTKAVEAGRHTLALPRPAAGMLLHRLTVGGITYTHKTVNIGVGQSFSAGTSHKNDALTLSTLSKRANSDFRDTIVVIFKGIEILRNAIAQPIIADYEIKSSVFYRVTYNGIVLPQTWPPNDRDPDDTQPMPVPYLTYPPKVIPINIGRQLFVDDFLIEKTTLERVFHQAQKFVSNPVFKPETHDELNRRGVVYLGQGGVFFDPADRLFKMFYTAGWRGPLAMATSPDLMKWTRPELSEMGNVLIDRSVDDNALWLDLRPSNAHERMKYMECHRHSHPLGYNQYLYTSADGRDWSKGVSAGRPLGDYSSLFYNPFRDVWVFSMRATDGMGRATNYCESTEFLKADWNRDAVYWQGADRLDEPEPQGSYHPTAHAHGVQLYSRTAVAYESLIIGMHQIHRGPHNRVCEEERFPKLTDLEVGFSRDGFHWHRPSRAPFLAGTRREGDWDRAYLHSTTGVFVVLGEKLVFPYTGYSGIGPDGSRGIYHGGSIGLAFLRRDGFASMDAGPSGGTLTTRPVTFNGTHLFVNAKVPDGMLRAEVLDQNGQPIEPFTLANSVPLTGDSTLAPMAWEGGSDLASLRGKPVRFRFELAGGSLYAFWVSLDESGRSDGFVAAGGPGYTGPTDTVGRAALVDSTKAKNR